MLDAIFLRHPHSVGESYAQHLATALGFAARLTIAAMACLVHALVPALFQRTASRIINELHVTMVGQRRHQSVEVGAFDYAI